MSHVKKYVKDLADHLQLSTTVLCRNLDLLSAGVLGKSVQLLKAVSDKVRLFLTAAMFSCTRGSDLKEVPDKWMDFDKLCLLAYSTSIARRLSGSVILNDAVMKISQIKRLLVVFCFLDFFPFSNQIRDLGSNDRVRAWS